MEVQPVREQPDRERDVALALLKELGSAVIPQVRSNIHCLTIGGQIEGHMVLPPQSKTTRYEHILPQLVALEQHPDIEGVLLILNTVGSSKI